MKEYFISPMYDFVFTQVFGTQRNIDNTKAFLKTLLDIPADDYDQLTVVNPILNRYFRRDKMGIVDLKLNTKSGKTIQIELQANREAKFRSRILYYAARMLAEQLRGGEKYGELRQVISIVICGHKLLEEEKSYINEYELRNRENRSFTDLLKVIILEIPKLSVSEDTGVWPWLQFFKCKRKEEFEMLAAQYPELKKPVQCVRKISLRERWSDYMLRRDILRLDNNTWKDYLLEKGKAEGLQQGYNEKLEIARKMKGMGLPIAQIAEVTGLAPETVETL